MKKAGRLGVLAERRFRLLWTGRTTSALGDALMPVTLVFAVLSCGGNATDIGLVLATTMVVRTLLLLVGGALADRLPRRLLIGGSDLFLCLVQSVMGVVLLTGRSSVALLLAAAVCYGAASAVSKPAVGGLVPQTVSPERLQEANGLMQLSRSAVQVAGPALAGVAVAVAAPGWVYLFDALTFLLSAATMAFLPLAWEPRSRRGSLFRDIADGWKEMTARTWYWAVLCGHAVWNVGSSAFYVLGPVVVSQQSSGAAGWGLVSAGMSVGALLGAAIAMRYRPSRPLVTAHLGMLPTLLQLVALAVSAPTVVIVGCAVLSSAGVMFLNTVWTSAVQRLVPEDVLSRVTSYDWVISFTVAPLGFAAIGPVSEAVGTAGAIHLAMLCVVLGVGAVLLPAPIRRLRQTPAGALHGWPELDEEGQRPSNEQAAVSRAH
ncbi:MFS transporter [Streptomyces mesophilus]|uniref:MFS transporter n=1 Tax=Streptomyces mesophilus TaxID=1775132 RepID=UPI00331AD3E7